MKREFESYGVMHFNVDCDKFVAAKKEFETAAEFLERAIDYEDAGFELGRKNNWNKTELFNSLLPFVKDNGYVVHRCSSHPTDYDLEDWWEFLMHSGRGHVAVWYIDMDEVEEGLIKSQV